MPGSPPISSTEPRTKPPPVTRSSSAMPEGRRGASCASPASGSSANRRPLRGARPGPGGARGAFLDQRVPLAAGLAFALPAGRRPAVLADEGQIALGHRESPANGPIMTANPAMRTFQEHSLRKHDLRPFAPANRSMDCPMTALARRGERQEQHDAGWLANSESPETRIIADFKTPRNNLFVDLAIDLTRANCPRRGSRQGIKLSIARSQS